MSQFTCDFCTARRAAFYVTGSGFINISLLLLFIIVEPMPFLKTCTGTGGAAVLALLVGCVLHGANRKRTPIVAYSVS